MVPRGNSLACRAGCWPLKVLPSCCHAGMASEAVLRRLHRIGQGIISADQGLLALAAALQGAAATAAAPALPQLAVNAFLWDTYLRSSQPAIFAEMAPARAEPELALLGARPASQASASRRRQAAAVAADPAAVREQVQREVAAAILQVGSQPGSKHATAAHGLARVWSWAFSAIPCPLVAHRFGPFIFFCPTAGGGLCRRRGGAPHVCRAGLAGLCGACQPAGAEAGHAGQCLRLCRDAGLWPSTA